MKRIPKPTTLIKDKKDKKKKAKDKAKSNLSKYSKKELIEIINDLIDENIYIKKII